MCIRDRALGGPRPPDGISGHRGHQPADLPSERLGARGGHVGPSALVRPAGLRLRQRRFPPLQRRGPELELDLRALPRLSGYPGGGGSPVSYTHLANRYEIERNE